MGPPCARVAPPCHPSYPEGCGYGDSISGVTRRVHPSPLMGGGRGGRRGRLGTGCTTLISFVLHGEAIASGTPVPYLRPPSWGSGVVASFGIAPFHFSCPRAFPVRSCQRGQGVAGEGRPSTPPPTWPRPPLLPGRPVQGTRVVGSGVGWVGLPAGLRGLAGGDPPSPRFAFPPVKRCVSLAPGRGKLVHLPRVGYPPTGNAFWDGRVAAS